MEDSSYQFLFHFVLDVPGKGKKGFFDIYTRFRTSFHELDTVFDG